MENVTLQDRFQKKLREALELHGWGQGDLAAELGVSHQMVSLYLNGKRVPGLDVVERFSMALGLEDAASLIDRSEIPQAVA